MILASPRRSNPYLVNSDNAMASVGFSLLKLYVEASLSAASLKITPIAPKRVTILKMLLQRLLMTCRSVPLTPILHTMYTTR